MHEPGWPAETPLARVELGVGKRRHRPFTGVSGLLLFACMFLPAVKGCSEPVYPFELPMFLPPYVFGLVMAAGAFAITLRGLRRTIFALRATTVAMVVGAGILATIEPPLGVAELFVAVMLLAAIGWTGYSERSAAMLSTVLGALCTLWFGMWATTSDALVGVYLSLVASLGLLLGGLVWLGETAAAIVIPDAIVRRRE